MLKNKTLLFCMVIAMIFVCCTNHQYDQVISRADNLMEDNQDSARVALAILDSIRPHFPNMNKSTQMRYQLIYAKGMNKGYIDFTTDSVMKEVVNYYENHGSTNEQMLAHYLLGCVYRDLGDSPASLSSYNNAVDKADTTSKDCDYKLLTRVYEQEGVLFLAQRMPQNAMIAYQKAEKYAWIAKDTLSALISYEHLGNIYDYMDSLNKAIEVFDKSYANYIKYGYKVQAARTLAGPLRALMLTHQSRKAKKYMEIYERGSGYFDDKEVIYPNNHAYYFYLKGMLYLDQNIDSTRIYFLKSQKLAKTSVDKYNIAHGWFYFYHKLNQVNNMNKYADLTIAYTDSVISEYEIEQMSKIQTVYNYSRWESIATQKEYETREARFTLYIYGISTFLVILLLCLFFVLYKKKVNRERKLKKEQISIIKQQIYTNNIEITKERKKLETARKEKSIMADEILQKEAKINSLVNEINALNEGVDLQENNIEGTKNKELISNRAIVIKFKQLVEYKKNATDNQWKTLENVFYYFHPQFRKTLEKNKALNENEFRVCMLVWLHFTPSQLTVLMGMSSSNVSNIRKRMASKIFGEEMTTSKFDKKIQEMA